ncbi:MAG: hypothetical protein FVQ80_06915 [Planctomycetes bacterium]|nr:hypothetical protein [Planctomycetota bacterium]
MRRRRSKGLAIALFREQWDWHFHHPTKFKTDWPRWKSNGGDIPDAENDCFLCEWVSSTKPNDDLCQVKCPVIWSSSSGHCNAVGRGMPEGEFCMWERAKTPRLKKKYAKLIRDLPERPPISKSKSSRGVRA